MNLIHRTRTHKFGDVITWSLNGFWDVVLSCFVWKEGYTSEFSIEFWHSSWSISTFSSYPVVREQLGAIGIHIPYSMRSDSELPRVSQPHSQASSKRCHLGMPPSGPGTVGAWRRWSHWIPATWEPRDQKQRGSDVEHLPFGFNLVISGWWWLESWNMLSCCFMFFHILGMINHPNWLS